MYQNSISFQAKSYFIVYIYNICFIHSFDDGYLGCFHFLATVNAMYIALNICFGSCFQFLGYIHRSGIAESCNSSFWGTAILFPIVAALAYHPICNVHQSHWYFIKKKSLSLLHMHTHTHTHAISLSSIHWTCIICKCQVSQEKICIVKHSLNNNKMSS